MSTITVKQLIRELSQFSDETPVYFYNGDELVQAVHNVEAETAYHLVEPDELAFVFDEATANDCGGYTKTEKVAVVNFG